MKAWRSALLGLPFLCLAGCGPDPVVECETPADCDDGEICTADLCDQGTCVNNIDNNIVPPQGSALDCKREACQGGRVVQVANDAETPTDNIACTQDACSGGNPVFTPSDNLCGAPPACRDLVCDPAGLQGTPDNNGCVAIIDNNNLPDDNADCTSDSCLNGNPVFTPDDLFCVSGAAPGCVIEACDPANENTGDGSGCSIVDDDTFCDDGNFCTTDACDPANGDPITGCTVTPNVGGQPAQIDGNCQEEICDANGNPSQIPDPGDIPTVDTDGVLCTDPGCNAAGQIIETANDNNCDDGLACTLDVCDAQLDCEALPDAGSCNPGEACDPNQDPGQNPSGCTNADTCPPTLTINSGTSVDGTTIGALDDFAPSCANNMGAHPDLAFALNLVEDSDIIISASPKDGQIVSVVLLPISGGVCGAELLCATEATSVDVDMAIINLAAGDYAIVVDGNGAAVQQGDFTLTVASAPTVITAGDLVLNEILANAPGAVSDTDGEYIELANPSSDTAVGTAGLTVTDGSATTNNISGPGNAQLIVPPGGFIVGIKDLDPVANGGVTADFLISFGVNNAPGDIFTIAKGGNIIDVVNTTASNPNGAFPGALDGKSFQLDLLSTDAQFNDIHAFWCVTPTSTYGTAGGFGSPGLPNDSCAAP